MNEPSVTLVGNVAAVPALRMAGGVPVTSFRVAVTPRRRDRASEEWSDGETLWFSVTAWRSLAEHCVTSLAKGDRVVVAGRMTQRSWTAEDGSVRPSLEVDAAYVGLELSRTSALSTRRGAPSQRTGEDAEVPGDEADTGVRDTESLADLSDARHLDDLGAVLLGDPATPARD